MAKIVRKPQKVFASTSSSNQVAQFGSLANSTPNFTLDPTVIQQLTQYTNGWYAAVIGNNSPAIQDMNALCYLFAYQLTYLLQTGWPEWDSATIYYIGSIATDGFGNAYVSLTDANTNNALTDSTKWSSAGGFTRNVNGKTVVVTSGNTYWYPNYNIPTGVTWTVNTGGTLMSAGTTVVNGTLIVNGTSIVL